MKNKIGIWLDGKKAIILSISNKGEKLIKVKSDIESKVRFYGETKKVTRMGNMFIDPEKTKEQRKLHQMKNYIKEILNNLKDASAIYISGPAQTKLLLKQELSRNKYFAGKVIAVENSDSMTERQICAKIRNFFATII